MGFPNLAGSSPAMGYPGPSPALASPGTGAALALRGPGAGHSGASMAAPTFDNVGASVFGQAAMNPTFGHTGFGPNVGNPAAFGHAAMTAVGHPGITGVHPAPAAVGHGGPSAAFGHAGPSAAFGHAGVYPAAVPKAAFGHAGVHPAASGHPGPSPGFGMAGPSPTPAPLPLQWGKDDATSSAASSVKKPPSRVLKEHKTI
eukprot:symbB.v1.2.014839.t1/scaffold1085.1/size139158/13